MNFLCIVGLIILTHPVVVHLIPAAPQHVPAPVCVWIPKTSHLHIFGLPGDEIVRAWIG